MDELDTTGLEPLVPAPPTSPPVSGLEPTVPFGPPRKRLGTLAIVLIVLAVLLLCCGGLAVGGLAAYIPFWSTISEVVEGSAPPPDEMEVPPVSDVASGLTIKEEVQVLADAIAGADADWSEHVADVSVAIKLQRPVIVLTLDLGSKDQDALQAVIVGVEEFAAHTSAPNGGRLTYVIEFRSAQGDRVRRTRSVDERWTLTTPPTPGDAAQLESWLSLVYCSS